MKGPLVLVLISALIAAPLFADTITLKSGESYTGEIIEETKEYIRLKTDSKILKIKRTAIAKVTTPEVEVEVELEEPAAASMSDATARAEAAAEAEVNKMLWFGAGFLIGPLAVLVAYMVTPSPPQSGLIGKPPEYVAAYTDAFKAKGKNIQTNMSLIGCLVGTGASCACYLIIFAAAAASTD